MAFIRFAGQNEIEYGDVRCRIPLDDGSVEVLYSSHMPEHLDHDDVQGFLKEAYRLLRPGGILRLAVPDLGFLVQEYLRIGDADRFIDATHLTRPHPRSLKDKILYIAVGPRNHQWLYDGPSLCRLLTEAGFIKVAVAEAGTTRILKPGPLNLKEGYPESVYVEAEKPCKQGAEVSQKTGARSR
jgi:predicted SAM-dependent methyltransferase